MGIIQYKREIEKGERKQDRDLSVILHQFIVDSMNDHSR